MKICSTDSLFEKASQTLINNFAIRGYPIKLIKSSVAKARTMNRDDLLKPQNSDSAKKQIIPFIITYNPFNPQIAKILSRYRQILEISEELKPITDSKTLVVHKQEDHDGPISLT